MPFKDVVFSFVGNVIINAIIYALIAIPFFLIFWKIFKGRFAHRRIQPKRRSTKKILTLEIKYSIATILIFALVAVFVTVAAAKGYTQIYTDIHQYGTGYLLFSIALILVLHDAWFYFTHLLLHHPFLFKHVHVVHHYSNDPSPFAALSFHPVEAFVQAAILIVVAFAFPVNAVVLVLWQLIQMTFNVIGHSGYEIYPSKMLSGKFFKWKTPSTHHNIHHAKCHGNYGLYFTWWDKMLKTESKYYDEAFKKVRERIAAKHKNLSESPSNRMEASQMTEKP